VFLGGKRVTLRRSRPANRAAVCCALRRGFRACLAGAMAHASRGWCEHERGREKESDEPCVNVLANGKVVGVPSPLAWGKNPVWRRVCVRLARHDRTARLVNPSRSWREETTVFDSPVPTRRAARPAHAASLPS